MRFIFVLLLFISIAARAQHNADTLNYSGGFDALIKHVFHYVADLDAQDSSVKTSTFYIALIDFDDRCKISNISLFVTGDTTFNSMIIRAIQLTEDKWSCTRSHPWRLSLPIYIFKERLSGFRPEAPTLGMAYATFNGTPAERNIKLRPIEITILPPKRSITRDDLKVH